jgi:multicomponent Na+:H+ antiporter subunit G
MAGNPGTRGTLILKTVLDVVGLVLCGAGAFFFISGSIGLVRFPDVYTRLHALTKADNLGLGLVAAGVAVQSGSWWIGLKVMVVWVLALLAAAAISCLIAASARRSGVVPWGN